MYQGNQFHELLGGVNNAVSDELIALNELSDARNYVPDPENAGVLVKREGITQVSSVQSTALIGKVHDGIHDIWACIPTDVINDAGTAQSLSLTSSTDTCWASFNNFDIVTNGTELKTYNGSTWAALGGTPPAFKYLQVYNRFLFGAGHSAAKIRWSAADNQASWPADNEWNLAPDANDDIVGLTVWQNNLYAFGERSFWRLAGFYEKAIQILHRGEPGCTSHRSIVPTPYGLFWWGYDGIYRTQDGVIGTNISELKIPKTFDGLNKAQFSKVHGTWNPNRQRIEWYACNGSGSTEDIAIYYYPRIGVSQVGGVQVGSFWVCSGDGTEMAASGLVTVSGEKLVYVGSAASSKYLYSVSGTTDDGASISAYLETRRDATEYGPAAIKRSKTLIPMFELTGQATAIYGVYLNNSQGISKQWSLTLTASEGFILDVDKLDVGVLGGGAVGEEVFIHWSEKFRKMKHRIQDEAGVRIKIRGIRTEGYITTI